MLDLPWGERAALGDVQGVPLVCSRSRSRLASWNIENVEFSACSRLSGVFLGRIVRDVVAVNYVVIPVTLTEFESRALESEGSSPGAWLGCTAIFRQRELVLVVVPGADQMDCLDVGRSAEGKRKLNCCRHYGLVLGV